MNRLTELLVPDDVRDDFQRLVTALRSVCSPGTCIHTNPAGHRLGRADSWALDRSPHLRGACGADLALIDGASLRLVDPLSIRPLAAFRAALASVGPTAGGTDRGQPFLSV